MFYTNTVQSLYAVCVDPEGGGGGVGGGGVGGGWTGDSGPPPPLKHHKNIGVLSNTCPDPLKTQGSIQCWAIIGMPEKRHLLAFWPAFSDILILSPLIS